MKQAAYKPLTLSVEQVAKIERAVFQQIEGLLDPAFYLLDVAMVLESGHWHLQVFADCREGNISLEQCALISSQLADKLDTLAVLEGVSYQFEVSSPGLFRVLKKTREFDFFMGQPVCIEKASGKENWLKPKVVLKPVVIAEGILKHWNEDQQTVTLFSDSTQQEQCVVMDNTLRIRLNPNLQSVEDKEAVSL
jgi:ribosome maturation factor RimP